MTGKEQVEQEEDAEGDVQIAAHHLLDAGAQHLDHHFPPAVRGAVHLAQRRGRDDFYESYSLQVGTVTTVRTFPES